MKRLSILGLTLLMGVCLLVASERRAWGYVDPGSGFLALQGAASVAFGFLFYLRRRLLNLFKRKRPEAAEPRLAGPVRNRETT